jgi:hypothetical protein
MVITVSEREELRPITDEARQRIQAALDTPTPR